MSEYSGETIIVPNCACGRRMTKTHACDVFVCMNCDGIQDQERHGFNARRKPTPQDHAFASEMRSRERKWYPEQFGGKDESEAKHG